MANILKIIYFILSYGISTFYKAYSSIIILCCNAAIPTLNRIKSAFNFILTLSKRNKSLWLQKPFHIFQIKKPQISYFVRKFQLAFLLVDFFSICRKVP